MVERSYTASTICAHQCDNSVDCSGFQIHKNQYIILSEYNIRAIKDLPRVEYEGPILTRTEFMLKGNALQNYGNLIKDICSQLMMVPETHLGMIAKLLIGFRMFLF